MGARPKAQAMRSLRVSGPLAIQAPPRQESSCLCNRARVEAGPADTAYHLSLPHGSRRQRLARPRAPVRRDSTEASVTADDGSPGVSRVPISAASPEAAEALIRPPNTGRVTFVSSRWWARSPGWLPGTVAACAQKRPSAASIAGRWCRARPRSLVALISAHQCASGTHR